MNNKRKAPASAATLHEGIYQKRHLLIKQLNLLGQLQSKIKIFLLEMYVRGYLSERLTRMGFKLFRLKGA